MHAMFASKAKINQKDEEKFPKRLILQLDTSRIKDRFFFSNKNVQNLGSIELEIN